MEWQKLEGTWKGGKQWSHLTTLWRRLQDLLVAIFAIIAWDSVADLAELAALENMGNGSARYVRTLRATFILDTSSLLAPDGITVVAAIGGGNWIRQAQVDPYWALQSTWYVNPTTGADENTGFTSGTALATLSEFGRRVQGMTLEQATTVWVEEDCLPADVLTLQCQGNQNAALHLRGIPAVHLEAVVLAWSKNVSAVGPGENNPGTIELDGWTVADHLGRLITFIDGVAIGGWAWLTSDLGAGSARVGDVLTGTYTQTPVATVQPAPGDTAQILSVPRANIALLQFDCQDNPSTRPQLLFDSLRVQGDSDIVPGNVPVSDVRGAIVWGYHLLLDNYHAKVASSTLVNCAGAVMTYAPSFIYGGSFKNIGVQADYMLAVNGVLIDAAFPISFGGTGIDIAKSCTYQAAGITALFGTMSYGIDLQVCGSFFTTERIIGSLVGAGIRMDSNSVVGLDVSDTTTLTTTGANITMTGASPTTMTWAQVPYVNPHTGSSVLATNSNTGNLTGGVTTDLAVGIKGALTAVVAPGTTVFALQDLTESAGEVPKLAVQNTVLGNLYAYLGTAPGTAADTVTIVVLVNGAPTALTCALSGATQAASDVNPAHRVRVAPGARISVRVTSVNATGVSFTGADLSVSLELG